MGYFDRFDRIHAVRDEFTLIFIAILTLICMYRLFSLGWRGYDLFGGSALIIGCYSLILYPFILICEGIYIDLLHGSDIYGFITFSSISATILVSIIYWFFSRDHSVDRDPIFDKPTDGGVVHDDYDGKGYW